MAQMVVGLFEDSKKAGNAVAELKQEGFTDDISVIAKDPEDMEVTSHQVKQDLSDGTASGAVTGGVLGGLVGLLVGVGTVALPGLGTLIVAGPLAAAWGLTGAAAGAITGGIVGALVDAGIPEERAREYEEAIKRGQVVVAVTADREDEPAIRRILDKHNAVDAAARQASA